MVKLTMSGVSIAFGTEFVIDSLVRGSWGYEGDKSRSESDGSHKRRQIRGSARRIQVLALYACTSKIAKWFVHDLRVA